MTMSLAFTVLPKKSSLLPPWGDNQGNGSAGSPDLGRNMEQKEGFPCPMTTSLVCLCFWQKQHLCGATRNLHSPLVKLGCHQECGGWGDGGGCSTSWVTRWPISTSSFRDTYDHTQVEEKTSSTHVREAWGWTCLAWEVNQRPCSACKVPPTQEECYKH